MHAKDKKRKGENIMGKKMQKFMAALAVTAVVGFPFTNVMAASKTFTNKSITTVANNETYYKVVEKVKADNEQYWYVTITNSVNLSTSGQPRLILTSAKNKTQARASSPPKPIFPPETRSPWTIRENKPASTVSAKNSRRPRPPAP